ncbi:MAG: hypothetical protein QXJ51_05545 [Sulfolobales archaeon]
MFSKILCPSIIIDGDMIYYHRLDELKSLLKQIMIGQGILRKYCDRDLIMVYRFKGLNDFLVERILKSSRIRIFNTSLEHILALIGSSKPLFLDPYARRDLTPEELLYYDSVIIGGIVDKPPRKRATTTLIELDLPWADSRRISLRGSIVGVPSEINSVIEIILRTLMYNDIERAIRETQSKRDALARVLVELNKHRKSIRCRDDIARIYEELQTFLKIDPDLYRRALYRARIPRDLWI